MLTLGRILVALATPEQVAEGLRTFTNVGVTYFMLRFSDFPGTEGVLRFAEEVMPLVRQG